MEKEKLTALVERSQAGDPAALQDLMVATYPSVAYLCRKMLKNEQDAEDATQEILLQVCRKLDTLRVPAAYWGWVNRMVANRCINAASRKAPELPFAEDEEGNSALDSFEDPDEDTVPDKALDNAETGRMMNELIDALPDGQRMCILLYYYDEMSVKDIAEVLEIPENTVKSRLNYGRKAIKEGVLRYEKEGVKLYSLAPVAYLFHCLGQAVQSGADPEAARAVAGRVLTAAGVATAAATTAGTAAATTASTAAAETAAAVTAAAPTAGTAAAAATETAAAAGTTAASTTAATGTVAGTTAATGTVAGTTAATGTVAGTTAATGTAAGTTAAGSAAATAATAVAAKAATGLSAKVIAAIVAGVLVIGGGGVAAGLALGNRPAEEPEEPAEEVVEEVVEEPEVPEEPAEEPAAEEPEEPDLTALLCDGDAYWMANLDHPEDPTFAGGETFCSLTFAEDGTFTGMDGWIEGEVADQMSGTYTVEEDLLSLDMTVEIPAYGGQPASDPINSHLEYRVEPDGDRLLWEQIGDESLAYDGQPGDRMIFVNGTTLNQETDSPATETPATETPAAETPATQTPAAQTPASNVFYNENNSYYTIDSVTVNPRYVYWDEGKLHAECFVVNGFSHPVYNINVKELSFSTPDGTLIASAAFGTLENVTLPAYSNVVWTFVFGEDCVFSPGADLTTLVTNYSTSNSY